MTVEWEEEEGGDRAHRRDRDHDPELHRGARRLYLKDRAKKKRRKKK